MEKAIVIHGSDNVAIALEDLDAGEAVFGLKLGNAIPRGHKFARQPIVAGAPVFKYGHPIGTASSDILPGAHVHSHNLQTNLRAGESYSYDYLPASHPDGSRDSFLGYRRANGKVGTRNEIWILNTVGCVNNTAQRLARSFRPPTQVEGVHAFSHPFGCSQLGDDLSQTRKLLAALAQHSNAGGVLILGLGCENNQLDRLLEGIENRERIRAFNAQAVADEEAAGTRALHELAELMQEDQRQDCPVSELSLGVKCGGSDGFSGLTANPLVGRMTDRVTAAGGTSILTEIPEIFGAEQLLMNRARSEVVFSEIVRLVEDFKAYFERNGQPIYENPSPGNKAGGITTLEEKSLGAVQKGGNAEVTEVIRYGERATEKGLVLLEAPGNDAVSCTALTAAGANLLLFTTGRGTPLGFPAPTMKIATNSSLAQRKANWIDFSAGSLVEGESIDAASDRLWSAILDVASGRQTQNECNDYREIAIWKTGVTL